MIYHLARVHDWAAALAAGEYRISTLGRTLDEVGFIHASSAEQLSGVAERFYRDELQQLVVLQVDDAGLDVRWEDVGTGELFPHVYGPIHPADVLNIIPAHFDHNGGFVLER